MIGIVHRTKFFEFRDESDLAVALAWYGDKYNGEIVIVTDINYRIKGVLNRNGDWVFRPDLSEETNYYIFGAVVGQVNEDDLQKNEDLPKNVSWELNMIPFAFISQKLPKEIDL